MQSKSLAHRLLMVAAEQLGCERGLLCGHLNEPSNLRDPQVAGRIGQVIGARKLLLGCGSSTSECLGAECGINGGILAGVRDPFAWAASPGGVVADSQGLFLVLGMTDEPLLDDVQLRKLKSVEDQALGINSRAPPELSDWYWLLTKLIDKVHEHVAHNILDHFRA